MKQPKPTCSALELCARAADILKKAGFVHRHTALSTESCYYEMPGREGLLRVSAHKFSKIKDGGYRNRPSTLDNVVAVLTFRGPLGRRDEVRLSDTAFSNHLQMAIGRYILATAGRAALRQEGK